MTTTSSPSVCGRPGVRLRLVVDFHQGRKPMPIIVLRCTACMLTQRLSDPTVPEQAGGVDGRLSRGRRRDTWRQLPVPPFAAEIAAYIADLVVGRCSATAVSGMERRECSCDSGVPQFLDYTLKDASGWDQYKERLQAAPRRLTADFDRSIAMGKAAGMALGTTVSALMGWIRNWMGVENMAYLIHDDPTVYADMVNTLADLSRWIIDKRELAKGRAAIDAEIERRMPLIRDGGFLPMPDHIIPPDISLEDYRYYLNRIRPIRV